MHAAKLLEVADMLDKLPELIRPDDQFDMSQWYSQSEDRVGRIGCGTAACAAGWASMLLPELGLLSRAGFGRLSLNAEGRTYYDFEAIAVACGITSQEANAVFNARQENDPLAVAVAIRKFVAEKEAASVPG